MIVAPKQLSAESDQSLLIPSGWQLIAFEVQKLWLNIQYYLHALTSCLDYFARKELFSGGKVLSTSANWGKKEDIPYCITPINDSDFENAAKTHGFSLKTNPVPLGPYNGGICFGSTLQFARVYLQEGVQKASQLQLGGASRECVVIQAHYENLKSTYYPKIAAALAAYLKNRDLDKDALLKAHDLAKDSQMNRLFDLTKTYTRRDWGVSYTTFMQTYTSGPTFATVRRADLLCQAKTPQESANILLHDKQKLLYEHAGLTCKQRPFVDASPQQILASSPATWEDGVYKIALPCTSRIGWVFFFSVVTLLAGLEMVLLGGNTTFLSLNLQHIGGACMFLGAIGAYAGTRKLKYEGQHAVLFIKENNRFILHDPNLGTGTHQNGDELLKNLFTLYVGDLKDQFKLIDIDHLDLRGRALPAVQVPAL